MVAMEEFTIWLYEEGEERAVTRRTTMSMQVETGVMMRMISSPRVERIDWSVWLESAIGRKKKLGFVDLGIFEERAREGNF